MIASILGLLLVLLIAAWATPVLCPSCGGTKWRSEPGLRECCGCGVWYEPARGRWRYALLSTRYRMPGLRGWLYRRDEL